MAEFSSHGTTAEGYAVLANTANDAHLVFRGIRCSESVTENISAAVADDFSETPTATVLEFTTRPNYLSITVEYSDADLSQEYLLKSWAIIVSPSNALTGRVALFVLNSDKGLVLQPISANGIRSRLKVRFYLYFPGASTYITQS